MPEHVHVPTRTGGQDELRYHTRADCPYRERANSVRERPLDSLPESYAECAWCANDGTLPNANGGGSRRYYEAAVNAGRDDE